MEFLRAIGRFILTQLAILGFLLLAPAIFVCISLFAIAGGAGKNPGGLAFLYIAAGPFVSAVWTMVLLQVRRVKRVTCGDVRSYKETFSGHLAAWGYLLYGFFGTLAAEVAFVLAFHVVSKRKRSSTSGKSAETAAMQNKLRAAALRIARLKRNGKSDEEILGLLDGDDHEAVLFQASLANMDELRAHPAGSMGELVYKRNQRYLGETCE
jgi:hypothetical protein